MKITKVGHCCLVLEIGEVKIMTDPGAWSSGQEKFKNIDAVVITHEHQDHLHIDSLKEVLNNNPQAHIITNHGVGKILSGLGIKHEVLTSEIKINGISLESFDAKHEEIFEEMGQVENTAFLFNNKLLYPGDSFYNPNRKVDILALPVAGPWCHIKHAINYALGIKPRVAFPVHDGMLQEDKIGPFHRVPSQILSQRGIEFVPMNPGESMEF